MNGNYLLDSNIIIDIFRGNQKVIDRIKEIKVINVPVIVIGELYFGAHKSDQTEKRVAQIQQLETKVTILEVTPLTANIYGELKNQLRAKGTPTPENDIWIAAITKEHDLTLITKDKDFQKVEGILIESM